MSTAKNKKRNKIIAIAIVIALVSTSIVSFLSIVSAAF